MTRGLALPEAGAAAEDLLEEIELADQMGLDVFGVGEHQCRRLSPEH